MSNKVVQECHLWLNLSQICAADKAVENFAQQFSGVQKQMEAIKHILPRRDSLNTKPPAARSSSALAAGRGGSPLLRAPLSLFGGPRSVAEMGDPEMTGTLGDTNICTTRGIQ
ncbi:hypothetical protein M9458_026202, partial [Cirrhinus mrigala]